MFFFEYNNFYNKDSTQLNARKTQLWTKKCTAQRSGTHNSDLQFHNLAHEVVFLHKTRLPEYVSEKNGERLCFFDLQIIIISADFRFRPAIWVDGTLLASSSCEPACTPLQLQGCSLKALVKLTHCAIGAVAAHSTCHPRRCSRHFGMFKPKGAISTAKPLCVLPLRVPGPLQRCATGRKATSAPLHRAMTRGSESSCPCSEKGSDQWKTCRCNGCRHACKSQIL